MVAEQAEGIFWSFSKPHIVISRESRLLLNETTNFTGKLLQSYKYLGCQISMILLKHVRDNLSVLFQFA